MKGDAFAHVMPRAFSGEFEKEAAKIGTTALFWPIDDLADLDRRVEVMDEFGIDQQVLALGSVPIVDVIPDSTVAARLARLANDSLAEMIADYPGRFLPVGTIAMDDMESGLTEAEHCLQDLGMLGIQIYSNARGRAIDHPEFFPLYAMAAEAGKPLWLHPARALSRADYVDEPSSYHSMAFVLGWPYETTQAMTRLVFAGIFEQLPELKIIVHHAGAMVPLLARRIETAYNQEHTADHTYTIMTTGEKAPLQRPVIDYFRMFYTDTASHGSVMAIRGAYEFFGPEHLLFGTDSPFDFQCGRELTPIHLNAIASAVASPKDRELIFGGNLQRLLA